MNRQMSRMTIALVVTAAGLLVAGAARALPVSFAPHLDHATGATPQGPVIGDLNGDHLPDIVIANYGSGSVSILLGDGRGGFVDAPDVVVGANPYPAALADVDGDGKLDLAVPMVLGGVTRVMLGNGAGGFGPPTDYPSTAPARVGFADLNRDGLLDMVVTNSWGGTGNSVSVRLGNGGGTFGPKLPDVDVGRTPALQAIVDMDGDGSLDVVTSNFDSNSLTILFGDGSGGFPARMDLESDGKVSGGAVGDLNGDGMLDLVAAGYATEVVYWLATGPRSYGPRLIHTTVGAGNAYVGDMNLDGKLDVVECNLDHVAVTLGNGDGTFGTSTAFLVGGAAANTMTIGDIDADGRPDIVTSNYDVNTVSVLLNTTGSTIAAQPPAACITPTHPCVSVPVTISRSEATPVRGYSVTVQLSDILALCPEAPVVGGNYLSSVATSFFNWYANGGGSYTIDGSILGTTCGATAPTGTLFTLNLSSAVPSGTGTVTLTSVMLRDCDNIPIAVWAGPPVSITVDNEIPAAITDLAATQVPGGNGWGPTTGIALTWTGGGGGGGGGTVSLYRAPFGIYPEYDKDGPVSPPDPAALPGAPWQLVSADATSPYVDAAAPRGFWYYAALVSDACGNVSPVSNRTAGTLDYLLGDVSDGTTPGVGNNRVFTEDISLLGAYYGTSGAAMDPVPYLDVGPTVTGSASARPKPDDRVNFEDLMMFAINYGMGGAHLVQQLSAARPALADHDAVALEAPDRVSVGEMFRVTLKLAGAGDLQGLSTKLSWDPAVAEPLSVAPGELASAQNALVLSGAPGQVDVAVLGQDAGLAGEGALAVVTFRATASGDPKLAIVSTDARDAANRKVNLGGATGANAAGPATTWLAPIAPNPFQTATTVSFSLARGGPVEVSIYSVDGRRVRTLIKEAREPGNYRLRWDGTDASGAGVRPGLFFVRLTTPAGHQTRTALMLR